MRIDIQTIPHASQRYPTCGDWFYVTPKYLAIRVSDLGCWRMEACLGFHELAEAFICKWQGITEQTVDAFDMAFKGEGEPGDDPACPYRVAHQVATALEFTLSLMLGVSWSEYEERINTL